MTVFVGNSNLLELIGLKDVTDDSYINDAAIAATVKDEAGVEVAGQTWPVTMAFVAASNGNYRGVLSEDVAFVAKTNYIAHIEANAGTNRIGHWEFKFKPLTRTGVTVDS